MASVGRLFARAVKQNVIRRQDLSRFAMQKQTQLLASRCFSTAAAQDIAPPQLDDEEKVYDPKIVELVDGISKLTLREVTDLNELLKKTLNIQDTPVFAQAGFGAPALQDGEADSDDGGSKEQTEFTVKLVSYEASNKIKVIKVVKSLKPELNLVQAKRFVESVPASLQEDVSKEEADELKKALEEAGAKVEVL